MKALYKNDHITLINETLNQIKGRGSREEPSFVQ